MEEVKLRRRVLQQQKMIEQLKSKVAREESSEGGREEGARMYVVHTPATISLNRRAINPPSLPPPLSSSLHYQVESLKMALARHENDERQNCARCVTWEEKTKQAITEGTRQVQEMKRR